MRKTEAGESKFSPFGLLASVKPGGQSRDGPRANENLKIWNKQVHEGHRPVRNSLVCLFRQPHSAQQIDEAWVRADGIPMRINFYEQNLRPSVVRFIEPG